MDPLSQLPQPNGADSPLDVIVGQPLNQMKNDVAGKTICHMMDVKDNVRSMESQAGKARHNAKLEPKEAEQRERRRGRFDTLGMITGSAISYGPIIPMLSSDSGWSLGGWLERTD